MFAGLVWLACGGGDTDGAVVLTGPGVVPIGSDTDGNGYPDAFYADVYEADLAAGARVDVAVDNGPEDGDPRLKILDETGARVATFDGGQACTYPVVTAAEEACPSGSWEAPSAGLWRLAVSVPLAVADPATYALTVDVDGESVDWALISDDAPSDF